MDEKELELYRFMKVALESGATIKMTEKGKGGLFVRGRKLTDKDLLECITDTKPITNADRIRNMDNIVTEIVMNYIIEHLNKNDHIPEIKVYIVWKAKVLQNWKYLLSSNLYDGMYYELTYNGNKEEWYLDAYKKFENRVVKVK